MIDNRTKIVFMGTPDFALPSLENLIKTPDFEVVAVVTQEDKKVGRKQEIQAPPIKEMALRYGIPVLQPQKIKGNKDFSRLIAELEPDFMVVVAYGKILPKELLAIPQFGCINVHASLLPRYRGASPIEEALLQGDRETGITIMEMDEKLDEGKIFFTKKIPIDPQDNSQTLRIKLSLLGAASLPPILREIQEGLQPLAQDEKKATYCHKINKEDGLVDLKKFTAEEILNRIRAYTPWPSCYIFLKGKRFKILEATVDMGKNIQPGEIEILDKNSIGIGTAKGLLFPRKVQLEGKSALPIEVFLAGNRDLFKNSLTTPQ